MAAHLAPGSLAYINYGEVPRTIHCRLLLAEVQGSEWMILTPDGDIYPEDLSDQNPDVTQIWYGPPNGALPAGVSARSVYGFRPMSAADVARAMASGRTEADRERALRGLGVPAAPVGVPVVAGGGVPPVAPPVPAAAAGQPAVSMVWVLAECVPGRKIGEKLAPPAGFPCLGEWGLMEITDSDGKTRPCLIKHLDVTLIGAFCDERISLARSSESCEGDDRSAGEDVRTLTVTYGMNGERQRGFRETVKEMTMCDFEDFPLQPRTTLEYCRAVASVAESATAQHHVWASGSRIPDGDRSLFEDEVLARVIDAAVMYDCLNISNLASMELICRRRQLLAEAHSASPGAPSYMGAEHFMGQTYKAGGGIVVPSLTDYVSKQMQAQSSIMKEKRKMEEAKSKGKGKPPKTPPKGGAGGSGT